MHAAQTHAWVDGLQRIFAERDLRNRCCWKFGEPRFPAGDADDVILNETALTRLTHLTTHSATAPKGLVSNSLPKLMMEAKTRMHASHIERARGADCVMALVMSAINAINGWMVVKFMSTFDAQKSVAVLSLTISFQDLRN